MKFNALVLTRISWFSTDCYCVCVARSSSILFLSRQSESALQFEDARCVIAQRRSWPLTWKCMAALQEARRIKDDGEKPEDERRISWHTHTGRCVISMRSMEKDRPGVKGQDYFYFNKHICALCNRKTSVHRWEPAEPHTGGRSTHSKSTHAQFLQYYYFTDALISITFTLQLNVGLIQSLM